MKTRILLPLGCCLLASLQPLSAQYVTGQWNVNEGLGDTIGNYSPSNYRWDMTILGNPGLWGYWQPGAYAFANGLNNAATAQTSAAAWTSGDNLTLKADFNVTGNVHDSGSIFAGGTVFGAGYFSTGGNGQGWNYGAFYATVNTADPAAPTIRFEISGIGSWAQALPAAVTNASINGGWNTAEWYMANNKSANSMTLQFRLNGTNVGSAISVSYYMHDFTDLPDYLGTKFYIGAQADGSYNSFKGSIRNVSLTATTPGAVPTLAANMFAGVTIQGTPGAMYQIQYVNDLASSDWQTITNIVIPSSPFNWIDLQSVNNSKRFYRAVAP